MFINAMVLILLLSMPVWRVVRIMCELFHGDELFLSFANFG